MVLLTVVPTSFTGVDSFDKKIQVYCHASSNIIARKRIRGERGDLSAFNLIAQR
jgi:hypothetical protein